MMFRNQVIKQSSQSFPVRGICVRADRITARSDSGHPPQTAHSSSLSASCAGWSSLASLMARSSMSDFSGRCIARPRLRLRAEEYLQLLLIFLREAGMPEATKVDFGATPAGARQSQEDRKPTNDDRWHLLNTLDQVSKAGAGFRGA